MVSVSARAPIGASIEADGVIRLTNGRELSLASIPGGSWNAQKLVRGAALLQALIDTITPLTDLDPLDPDRITDPGRPEWYHSDSEGSPVASGATHITHRPTVVSLAMVDGNLMLGFTENL